MDEDEEEKMEQPMLQPLTLEDLLNELEIDQYEGVFTPFHERISLCLVKLKDAKAAIKASQQENLQLMRDILQKEKNSLGNGFAIPQQRSELYLR